MGKRSALEQSKDFLKSAGVCYRLRMMGTLNRPRSQWLTLYDTATHAGQSVHGLSWSNDAAIDRAARWLRDNPKKSFTETHQGLSQQFANGGQISSATTWGSIRSLVKQAIGPGGEKERDKNPFKAFKDRGHFGVLFDDDAVALTSDLEQWARFTPASIQAREQDANQPLIPRRPGSSVFHQCIQAVNWLAAKKVAIATPELMETLNELKTVREDPAPDFIPRDTDLEKWIETAIEWDPEAGFIFAMMAVFGLRPHEVWHITMLPGEVDGDDSMVQVGFVVKNKKQQTTKTGHRFCKALPVEWMEKFRLNDLDHATTMLQGIQKRWPVRANENASLGIVVSHLMHDSARPERCMPKRLLGYYRPDPTEGNPTPREKRGYSTSYDLRHRWALRCLDLAPHWSTDLKAELMGHSAAIHKRTYLRNVSADQKLNRLQEILKQAEDERARAT